MGNPIWTMKEKPSFRAARFDELTNVPQKQGAPPVAPARVATMKANYRQAWLYFLLAVCLLIAWGIPLRFAINRYLLFRPAVSGPRDAHSFVAIAYEGVSASPREVSPDRFREQIAVLRRAGYNPITLDDVNAFYEEGQPLPRRAILVTFDHSRKSAYFEARSVLRRAGWPAVAFLWLKPILDEDQASLRWPYIRAMVGSSAWEVGSQSYMGFERIVVDSEGTTRNFMVAPRWLENEMRHETPEAFQQRLIDDHEFARRLIARETGDPPRAFAYPFGDYGQFDDRAFLSRRLNRDLISRFYDLAFTHGHTALNTRDTDPIRLNRLLVRPEWSGQDLLDQLEASWPRAQGFVGREALVSSIHWLQDWGDVEIGNNRIALRAQPETTGATAWLNGTGMFQDLSMRFRVRIDQGQLGVFIRATTDGERHLYVGLGDSGEVWLRQKHADMPPFTLASTRYAPEADGTVVVDVVVRGRLFTMSIGGETVFKEQITLRGEPRHGMVGFSIWHPERGRAEAEILELEAVPLGTTLMTWAPTHVRAATLAAWMNQNAIRFSHFSPPWLEVAARSRVEQLGWDPNLFEAFSRIYDMKWLPEIVLNDFSTVDVAMAIALVELAEGLGTDGIFLNMEGAHGNPSLTRVTSWIQAFERALRERELSLVVQLPPALERETTFSSLLQSMPGLHIGAFQIDSENRFVKEPEAGGMVRVMRVTPADVRVPLYDQLIGGDAAFDRWDLEQRGQLLRQEGHEAFMAGRFEQAIQIWTRWSELEPANPEPYRLIGNAHLRNQHVRPALESYQASLEVNPGQIPLVVHSAMLLDQRMNQREEAMAMLDLYGRLFPNKPDLLLARAQLLVNDGRRDEAEGLIQRVIDENPDDLIARSMLHGLLPTSIERSRNLDAILDIGSRPGMAPHFAQTIRTYNLLAWPESWRLMDFIESRAAEEQAEDQPAAFSRLAPRQTVVQEAFDIGGLSDQWVIDTDDEEVEGGAFLLAATAAATEASIQLVGSDAMHSGFIEAEIDEVRGFFWMYARRGEESMIRFGFDQTGRLYLQIWKAGRIHVNQSRFWTRPDGVVRLRLEVRGDAAYGFIDGDPAFGAPVQIPRTMGLGWWGLSPWAPQLGVAEVNLRELAGGPLPVTLALFRPRSVEWTDSQMLDMLRPFKHDINVVSPQWFVQDLSGRVRPDFNLDYSNLRILARFYQMRLMPLIRAASPRTLNVESLIPLARSANVDGFTALFSRMPDEDWFREAEEALIESDMAFIAVRINEHDQVVEVREVFPYVGVFAGARRIHRLELTHMGEDAAHGPPRPAPEVTEVTEEADERMISEGESGLAPVDVMEPRPNDVPSIEYPAEPHRVLLF